MVAGPKKPKQ